MAIAIFQAGKGTGSFLQAFTREIWLTFAAWGITLAVGHRAGVTLTSSVGALTWWHLGQTYKDKVDVLLKDKNIACISVRDDLLHISVMTFNLFHTTTDPASTPISNPAVSSTFLSASHYQNNIQQASTFMNFCVHYHLSFIMPSVSTTCCYITYLTQHCKSASSVRNYISGVRFLHKELGLTPDNVDSSPVSSLLRPGDITTRVPPLRHLPILPTLLHQLCL